MAIGLLISPFLVSMQRVFNKDLIYNPLCYPHLVISNLLYRPCLLQLIYDAYQGLADVVMC